MTTAILGDALSQLANIQLGGVPGESASGADVVASQASVVWIVPSAGGSVFWSEDDRAMVLALMSPEPASVVVTADDESEVVSHSVVHPEELVVTSTDEAFLITGARAVSTVRGTS